MKLLCKLFLFKQIKTTIILVLLSFITLLTMQVSVTVWVKNLTLAQRVDEINGAHTHLYFENEEIANRFDHYIEIYQEAHQQNIRVEKTYAFPYSAGNQQHDIFFEGYVSSNTNNYHIIEGKRLSELVDFEVAISESYARKLRSEGIEPLNHLLSFDNIISNSTIVFTVKSIIDYPNFNDAFVFDQRLKSIPLFDYPFVSVGIGNYQTISELASLAKQTNNSASFAKIVSKVSFENYSHDMEQAFIIRLFRGFMMDHNTNKVLPLYEITDYLSISHHLYKHLSLVLLSGFLLAAAYTFMVYLKRQLLLNAKNIGLCTTIGINHWRIQFVFVIRYLLVIFIAIVLMIVLNQYMINILNQNRDLTKIFDYNPVILMRTLQLAAVYFLLIYILYQLQLNSYISKSFSTTKTKGKIFTRFPQIRKIWMPIIFAFKSMFAHIGFHISTIVTIGVLIFMLLTGLYTQLNIGNMYNKETLGIQFDYLVTDGLFSDFEFTKEYSTHQAMLEKYSNYYFVDVNFTASRYKYYKSNMIFFLADMGPFVPIIEGTTPPDIRPRFYEFKFEFRAAVASRKHMDKSNSYVYSVQKVSETKNAEGGYLFYLIPQRFYNATETAAVITGTSNTLIDNGWIAFVYRDRQMIELSFPTVDMYIFNVKDEVDRIEFERMMDQRNMNYIAFDTILSMLSAVNQENQRDTLYFILMASLLMLVVLVTNIIAYFAIMRFENKADNEFLHQIGLRLRIKNLIRINQLLFVTIASLSVTQLLMISAYPWIYDGVLQAYGLYQSIPLATSLTSYLPYSIYLSIIILIVLNLSSAILSPKSKEI